MIMVIKNPSNSHLSPLDVPGGDKPPSKMGVLIYSDRKTCSVVVPYEVEISKTILTIMMILVNSDGKTPPIVVSEVDSSLRI